MNRWVRRIVAVLEIGGGFMGIMALWQAKLWVKDASSAVLTLSLTLAILLVFLCLGLLGIAAGLLVAENRRLGLWLSLLYQAVQIPVILSAAVIYQYLPGLQVVAGHFGDSASVFLQCQSKFAFFIGRPPDASGCGLNLSALFFFLYLAWVLGRSFTRTTGPGNSKRDASSRGGCGLALS
jgi:hypothetical protein